MNHEKEIDRLGVEYSAGIEDFKEYVVRLFNMDPYERYDLFISREMDSEGYLEQYPENVASFIIENFSARCIIDTLDSYDIEREKKSMEKEIMNISKLLKPGNALYLRDKGCCYPILVLSWSRRRSFPDRVLITFYDIISETIRSDAVVDIKNISEVDFAYDDIDDLVSVFMNALEKQTKDYFEWKDREERIKHEEDTSGKHYVRLSNPGDKVEDLGILTWKEVRSLDKSIDQSKSYLDTFQIGDQDKFRVFHITPKKRCGRFKWEDKSRLYKAAEEALNKEREEREKAVIRNRIDEISYSGRSLRERFPNLYSEEDDD